MNEEPIDTSSAFDDYIDERCDAFESAWRRGERPSIAEFLGGQGEPFRKKLFEALLLVDMECRQTAGEQLTQELYLREFPEFAATIVSASFQYGEDATAASPIGNSDASDAVRVLPGTQIDHFQIVELLGEGAMGQAWKAWDMRLRRHVTIKLPRNRRLSERDRRRFLRESEAAAQFSHPRLTSIHEVRRRGDSFYIVAKYVEGANLRDYVGGRKLSYDEIAELCAELGDALEHAHRDGVVHRDLKPANIIVDLTRHPHIIDFGLAKFVSDENDLTMNGELLGTPAYMSPELASGRAADADARTDIYSLGIILYELLAGHCPYRGNRGDVISQILTSNPKPPRQSQGSIPRDLQTICLKAIEKKPENRYSSAGALAEDLRRFLARQPIRARRVSWAEHGWRWTRRHPVIAASIAAGVSAIVAVGVTMASLHKQNQRLEGYRPVVITTTPSGARVAVVPIDPATNEPSLNPNDVICPAGTTPLTISLKPRKYLIEASVSTDGELNFVEVYRNVIDSSRVALAVQHANRRAGLDPDTCKLSRIVIESQREVVQGMIAIPIGESLRRSNPSLPAKLYVDEHQTTATSQLQGSASISGLKNTQDGKPYIYYRAAEDWAELHQKRLPSAAEYDGITAAVRAGKALSVESGAPVQMEDLFDDSPEFSTTHKDMKRKFGTSVEKYFGTLHILKGFTNVVESSQVFYWLDSELVAATDSQSSIISIRGVRSATPRFVKP